MCVFCCLYHKMSFSRIDIVEVVPRMSICNDVVENDAFKMNMRLL